MPNDFLRIANDSGLIEKIGSWVIAEVCRRISEFRSIGIILPHVAVNVSPRQFQTTDICNEILVSVNQFGIQPGQLVVEITEELLLNQSPELIAQLVALRRNGIDLSIDDFGTGYSSLQYLRDLPASRLKIDQTFISRIEHSSVDRAIISTISHLAHALDMRVVAEGVETETQFSLLRAAGCDELQGYLFGRALSIEDLFEHFDREPVEIESQTR
jgi:EAL domain-containing protein (putative c-di-GMP-specific phosphodiesterase class I)